VVKRTVRKHLRKGERMADRGRWCSSERWMINWFRVYKLSISFLIFFLLSKSPFWAVFCSPPYTPHFTSAHTYNTYVCCSGPRTPARPNAQCLNTRSFFSIILSVSRSSKNKNFLLFMVSIYLKVECRAALHTMSPRRKVKEKFQNIIIHFEPNRPRKPQWNIWY
jgi:hypothetical protein